MVPTRAIRVSGQLVDPATEIEYLRLAIQIDPSVMMIGEARWDRPCPAFGPCVPSVFERRHDLVRRYAWAIPTDEALNEIAARSPIVEMGAGTGYWASLLAARGADVIAYDRDPGCNTWIEPGVLHFDVRPGTWLSVKQHADRTLFLCWPPMNPMANNTLRCYRGACLVYIGEGEGGCTADDPFFRRLGRDWHMVASIDIPQWLGVHDRLGIYERK